MNTHGPIKMKMIPPFLQGLLCFYLWI